MLLLYADNAFNLALFATKSVPFISAVLINLVPNAPFASFILSEFYATIDPSLEEAARTLGAGKMTRIFKILLPQIAPGMISAAIFIFMRAFNEVILTYLVVSPEVVTLPVLLFVQQIGSPVLTTYELAALSIFLLIPGIIFLVLMMKFMKGGFSLLRI